MTTRVAVAASSAQAAAAAVRLAQLGGNAVDAALAAIVVSTVCEPGVAALGGGAFITLASADGGPAITVDGNVEMPGRGLAPERFGRGLRHQDSAYGGGQTITYGHGSVATPGALAAFDLAHRRHGRAPWREVLAPAVEAARDGFPLGTASAYYLAYVHDTVFGWHPDSYRALHDEAGRLRQPGDKVHIDGLADTLQLLADEGAEVLYRGELGTRVTADMAEHEGLLTAADLAAYAPLVQPALDVGMGDWRLATNPPPAIGGVVLAAMLTLLAGRDRAADGGWAAADVADLVQVQDAVLRHRLDHLDLASDRVAAASALLAAVGEGDLRALRTSPSTVHVSVVDAAGGACAITSSAGYGSGVMTPGTGLWLNNCLGEPELNRGGWHALAPGTRLPSNMAPTVGRRPDGAVLAVGTPGADRITTALLQVLAGFAGGLTLGEAIDRPRLHVRHLPGGARVDHEEDLALPPLDLPTFAHPARSMYFGGVGAALRQADGTLLAAADPRRTGVVAVGPG